MRVKIYDGTPPQAGESLCDTCRHATITRGRRLNEEIVRCEAQPSGTLVIHFAVTECSSYFDERLPSFSELMRQAWILKTGTSKQPAGFVRTSDLSYEERIKLISDASGDFDD